MNLAYNPKFINLQQVQEISRGNEEKVKRYLNQFVTLIPDRLKKVNAGMESEDRAFVRRMIHNMSPQIQFFGIPETEHYITKLEYEYETMPIEEMQEIVKKITKQVTLALEEVKILLE